MVDESILGILELMLEGRNNFLNNTTIRSIDHNARTNILSRYMLNDAVMLDFLNRIYVNRAPNTTVVHLTLPNNSFMEPVTVNASVQQIQDAIQNMTTNEGTCAICQDAITSNGVQIRYCSHGFHRTCISNWFAMSVRCPVCRHDIREGNQAAQTSPVSSQTSVQQEDQLEEH